MNEVILHILAQFHEIGAVPGHADQQIPVVFRMLLCVDERLAVQNIVLDVEDPIIIERPVEIHEFLEILLVVDNVGCKFNT